MLDHFVVFSLYIYNVHLDEALEKEIKDLRAQLEALETENYELRREMAIREQQITLYATVTDELLEEMKSDDDSDGIFE